MNVRTVLSPRQHQLLRVAVFMSLLMLCCTEPGAGIGQTPGQKRKLINLIPTHLPLKIEVRNFDEEDWLRELEVKVTNISGTPTYFLDFFITFPDVRGHSGNPVGFGLKYGRPHLIELETPIELEDVPIQPDEIHVLKIGESYLKGWERSATRKNLLDGEPKKVELMFAHLSFGDGTGFQRTDGLPFNIHRKKAGHQ